MDQQELKAKIASIVRFIETQMTREQMPPEHAALAMVGIEIAGGLLLDIKRIADAIVAPFPVAADRPAPDSERLAQFLASKEAFRKIMDDATAPELETRRAKWAEANWRAFQEEADELIAAASGAIFGLVDEAASRVVSETSGDK